MGHNHIEKNNYFLHQNLGEIGNDPKKKKSIWQGGSLELGQMGPSSRSLPTSRIKQGARV